MGKQLPSLNALHAIAIHELHARKMTSEIHVAAAGDATREWERNVES
jgi:hypothetical protein